MPSAPAILEEQLLRDSDVATAYGINRATVWTWAKAGRIPKPVKDMSRWRKSEVMAHICGMKHSEMKEQAS